MLLLSLWAAPFPLPPPPPRPQRVLLGQVGAAAFRIYRCPQPMSSLHSQTEGPGSPVSSFRRAHSVSGLPHLGSQTMPFLQGKSKPWFWNFLCLLPSFPSRAGAEPSSSPPGSAPFSSAPSCAVLASSHLKWISCCSLLPLWPPTRMTARAPRRPASPWSPLGPFPTAAEAQTQPLCQELPATAASRSLVPVVLARTSAEPATRSPSPALPAPRSRVQPHRPSYGAHTHSLAGTHSHSQAHTHTHAAWALTTLWFHTCAGPWPCPLRELPLVLEAILSRGARPPKPLSWDLQEVVQGFF